MCRNLWFHGKDYLWFSADFPLNQFLESWCNQTLWCFRRWFDGYSSMDCDVKSCHHTAPLWALSLPLPTTVATTTGGPTAVAGTAGAGTAAWGLSTHKKSAANLQWNKYNRTNTAWHTVKPVNNKQLPSTTIWWWVLQSHVWICMAILGVVYYRVYHRHDNDRKLHIMTFMMKTKHVYDTDDIHIWYSWYSMHFTWRYITLH